MAPDKQGIVRGANQGDKGLFMKGAAQKGSEKDRQEGQDTLLEGASEEDWGVGRGHNKGD